MDSVTRFLLIIYHFLPSHSHLGAVVTFSYIVFVVPLLKRVVADAAHVGFI